MSSTFLQPSCSRPLSPVWDSRQGLPARGLIIQPLPANPSIYSLFSALDLVGIAWRYPGISGLGSGILRLVGLVLFHHTASTQRRHLSALHRLDLRQMPSLPLGGRAICAALCMPLTNPTAAWDWPIFLNDCDHDNTATGLLPVAAPELSTIANHLPIRGHFPQQINVRILHRITSLVRPDIHRAPAHFPLSIYHDTYPGKPRRGGRE